MEDTIINEIEDLLARVEKVKGRKTKRDKALLDHLNYRIETLRREMIEATELDDLTELVKAA